jgi:chromate reductase, NAD(P)H dehydrogenase (quinone)
MAQYEIAVLVGSLRQGSLNARLATALERLAPDTLGFRRVQIGDLPLYDQDDDASPSPPVARLREAIGTARGVIFVTPEYNRSVPGVLKNAIDHGSRPYGHSVWAGKPAGVMGISPGAPGTAMAQQHLRNILAYLDMPTLGQPEVFMQYKEGLFDAEGAIAEGSRAFLQGWMDRYVAFLERHAP